MSRIGVVLKIGEVRFMICNSKKTVGARVPPRWRLRVGMARTATASVLMGATCMLLLSTLTGCATDWNIHARPSTRVRRALSLVSPAVVRIDVVMRTFNNGVPESFRAIGSGVIIDRQGRVLTNFHVAGRARRIEITLADQGHVRGKLIGSDHWTDLALVQMDMKQIAAKHLSFRWATLGNSSQVQLGEPVMALGTPYGLARTVTRGIISNTDRYFNASTIDGYETGWFNNWLQTDAGINPGNSGGPLINLKGQVIGINTRGDPTATDLGFAIPINVAKSVIPSLLQYHRVTRSYIGVELQPLRDLNHFYKISGHDGVLIRSVDPDSPAASAGLQPQDILLSVNGHPTNCRFPEQLAAIRRFIADQKVHSTLTLLVDRPVSDSSGKLLDITVETQRLESAVSPQHGIPGWGIAVRNLTKPYLRNQRLPMIHGVLVTGVRPSSPADNADLQAGDIIERVNGTVIGGSRQLQNIVKALRKKKQSAAVLIRRGRSERTLVLSFAPTS